MRGSLETVAPSWASWGTARTVAAADRITGTDEVKRRAMSAASRGTATRVRMLSNRSSHTTRSSGAVPSGSIARRTAAVGS